MAMTLSFSGVLGEEVLLRLSLRVDLGDEGVPES